MPLNPPPGWIALQQRAKQIKDPQELVDLIEEMNQLLSEYERSTGDGDGNANGNGRPLRKQKPARKESAKSKK